MGNNGRGLVDGGQTPAGGTDSRLRRPGAVVAVAVLALLICVASFALGEVIAGVYAGIIGLSAFGAGLAWLTTDVRRLCQAERDRMIHHR